MATRAEVARRAGLRLKILDEGENLSTTQSADLVQALDDLRAYLLERGLCWWDADSIPASVTAALADWLAYEAAPAFGKQRDATMRQEAVIRLNDVAPSEQRPVLAADYF